MAKRMALLPEELVTSHHMQKPEIRIENELTNLLDRETLPDDMKVKLLSQLMMRYKTVVHTPPEPVRVTIDDDKASNENSNTDNSNNQTENMDTDAILKDIIASSPRPYWKFIPMIVEKLKTRSYSWNEYGELTANGVAIKNSKIADFFSFLFRNTKMQKQPMHFEIFLRALKEINIPHYWVGNKKLLDNLKDTLGEPSFDSPSLVVKSSTPKKDRAYTEIPMSKRLNLSIPKWKWSEI